jgi:hypothetical protein
VICGLVLELLLPWVWTEATGNEANDRESGFDEVHESFLIGT